MCKSNILEEIEKKVSTVDWSHEHQLICVIEDIYKSLLSIIEYIVTNNHVLIEISNLTYVHANGFLKIPIIARKNNTYQLRLHIWPQGFAENNERIVDIHNHRWPFCSKVILGEFLEKRFSVQPISKNNTSLLHTYNCFPRKEDETLQVVESEQIGLVFDSEKIFYKNDINIFPANKIHYFLPLPSDSMSATLVLTGNVSGHNAKIFTDSESRFKVRKPKFPSLSPESLKETLLMFKSEVAGARVLDL